MAFLSSRADHFHYGRGFKAPRSPESSLHGASTGCALLPCTLVLPLNTCRVIHSLFNLKGGSIEECQLTCSSQGETRYGLAR